MSRISGTGVEALKALEGCAIMYVMGQEGPGVGVRRMGGIGGCGRTSLAFVASE